MSKRNKYLKFVDISMACSFGIIILASVSVAFFIGKWADGKLNSEPWGSVISIFFGFATGMWSVFKQIMKQQDINNKKKSITDE